MFTEAAEADRKVTFNKTDKPVRIASSSLRLIARGDAHLDLAVDNTAAAAIACQKAMRRRFIQEDFALTRPILAPLQPYPSPCRPAAARPPLGISVFHHRVVRRSPSAPAAAARAQHLGDDTAAESTHCAAPIELFAYGQSQTKTKIARRPAKLAASRSESRALETTAAVMGRPVRRSVGVAITLVTDPPSDCNPWPW